MKPDSTFLEMARSEDSDRRQRAALRLKDLDRPDELSFAFEMLGDKDWRVRKTVVDTLVSNPSDDGISRLLSALSEASNAGKRNSATEALIRIGEPVIPFVIHALSKEADLDVRLSLINLLGDLRNRDAFDTLLALLAREEDRNILSSIVSSVGKYRNSAAIAPLIGMLPAADLWLKFHLIEALGEIGDPSVLPAILPLYDDKTLRKPVLEAIGRIGDPGTVNFLLKVIAGDERLNLVALRALVQIAEADRPRVLQMTQESAIRRSFRESFPPSKIAALVEQLQVTPKLDVRNFILKLLGWSGDPGAVTPLLSHLSRPDTAESAAQAVIDIGAAAAPELVAALHRSEDDETTILLLRIARIVAGESALPAILLLTEHENPSVRRVAAETLGELHDPRAIDYLLAKLDDPDVATQQAAVTGIESIAAARPEVKEPTLRRIRGLLNSSSLPVKLNSLWVFVDIQGEGYHDELLLASKDQDPVIRQKAISLMSSFPGERFADQVVLSLADEHPAVRLAAIQSLVTLRADKGLEPLLSSLEDSDVWIRAASAQALGGYASNEVTEALVRHASVDAIPVRIAAIQSLAKSGRPEVIQVLAATAHDADPELKRASILALWSVPGDEALGHLMSALTDIDWRIRAAAAESLGARREERALDVLHLMLQKDRDEFVQQSVVHALEKIGARASFPHLIEALENRAILDDVAELLVRKRDVYGDLLEQTWRTADRQHEAMYAAILQARPPERPEASNDSLVR